MKTAKKVLRKRMTFHQIVAKTIREKRFLNDLVKHAGNPKRFLDAKGILLSENDLWRLKGLLNRSFSIKGPEMIKLLSGCLSGVAKITFPPPPPWPPYGPEFRKFLSQIPERKKPRKKRKIRK
ncbi:hypothetical protein JW906_04720 [bacterium]|nr:hypothetical protein [bacterium]